MDFITNTGGDVIVCHHTKTPCNPMCPFYIEQPAGYALCADVENSFLIMPNSSLSHPWAELPLPARQGRDKVGITPDKTVIYK